MGVVVALVLAAFVAAHASLVAGLARRHPRWRALAALAVPALAPWWGWGAGMRKRAILWLGALAAYTLFTFSIRWLFGAT
jgi:hypothetical protein